MYGTQVPDERDLRAASRLGPSAQRDARGVAPEVPSDADVLASLAVGVVVHAEDGSVIAANPAAWQIFGVGERDLRDPDPIRLRTDLLRADGSVWAVEDMPVATTLRTDRTVSNIIMGHARPDGSVLWASVSTRIIERAGGGRAVVVTLVDVTDMQEGLRNLDESQRSFEPGFDESPFGILVVDKAGRIVRTNAALQMLIGWSADEMLGQGLGRILHPDELRVSQAARYALARGEHDHLNAERRLQTRDGETVHVMVSTVVVRDESGDLSHFVTHIVDVTDHRRRHDELRFLADHDALTGLKNRRGFEIALAARLSDAQALDRVALLMVDLDRFKQVNDVHGHALGDLLIKRVAEVIAAEVGSDGIVGRIGGDEFTVLVADTTTELAAALAQRLVDAIGTMPSGVPELVDGRVGASVGVAMVPPGGTDGKRLLARADEALYRAKRAGRGMWAIAEDG